jgi:hypothetical protein
MRSAPPDSHNSLIIGRLGVLTNLLQGDKLVMYHEEVCI